MTKASCPTIVECLERVKVEYYSREALGGIIRWNEQISETSCGISISAETSMPLNKVVINGKEYKEVL